MAKTAGDGRRGISWRMVGWGAAALLLLTPLVAMQFTDEVDWDPFDFVFMGVLMGSVGVGIELAVRRTADLAYRIGAGLALVLSFLLLWINAAVGVIGSEEDHGVNLLFVGVIGVALAGSVLARFRPMGMARAMAAAAVVQALVPAIAGVLDPKARISVGAGDVMVFTGVFTAAWLLAAWLFRHAARRRTGA